MDERNFNTRHCDTQSDVVKFYDDYAQDWNERFGEAYSNQIFFEDRWRAFEKAIPTEGYGARAIELGVGTGVAIVRSANIFSHIIAIDGSKPMLDELEKSLAKFRIDNVNVLQRNVNDLHGISDASVDVCYFFALIEHVIDMDGFLAEVYRVLRPGGHLIGVASNGLCPWYSVRPLVRGARMHCSTDKYYTVKDIRKLFARNGFEFKRADYWGTVPPGLTSRALTWLLKGGELLIKATPMRALLGGFVFVGKRHAGTRADANST